MKVIVYDEEGNWYKLDIGKLDQYIRIYYVYDIETKREWIWCYGKDGLAVKLDPTEPKNNITAFAYKTYKMKGYTIFQPPMEDIRTCMFYPIYDEDTLRTTGYNYILSKDFINRR